VNERSVKSIGVFILLESVIEGDDYADGGFGRGL